MSANGILLYTRAYNAASTAAQPAAIAVQIGKGLKGVSKNLYKSAAKVTSGSFDYFIQNTTAEYGVLHHGYNEVTGILYIDVGQSTFNTNTTRNLAMEDGSYPTSGYLVINASKNPALAGVGIERVAARAFQTSAQSITNTGSGVVITYDAAKSYDTHGALNAATGVFTAPFSGYYEINGSILYNTSTWAVGNVYTLSYSKNGGGVASLSRSEIEVALSGYRGCKGSDVVYLNKGDTLAMLTANTRTGGATTLIADSSFNYLSIVKVSGIN
jgi:hypothetical protein